MRWFASLFHPNVDVFMTLRARDCLAGVVLCLSTALPGWAAEVTPHRAIYQMTLLSSRGGSDIADVNGTMQFEWKDACDGWAIDQRSLMTFLYNTGEEVDLGWSLVSWESKDGLRYRFYVRKYQNGELYEELRGDAKLDGPGKGGVAQYSLPEPRKIHLPAGTLFATAHSLKLLELAESGGQFLWATVFDGSDEEGLFGVNAIVSDRREAEGVSDPRSPLLVAGPSWHVALAFFAATGQGAEPEHEQSLRLHANGVTEDLVLDYGDFTVSATLQKIEKLPPAKC
ncbi:MAG: hypothetical protein BroJett029_35070 [Alphaproteobacteria bacterium]|nr:MAG: hypothetical protein BroJett029_35070 [Alphaproteobacteria bacterium]